MSAVMQDHAHTVDQLPLIAPPPAVQASLLELAVWGRVDRQAQVRISTDGSVHLVVEILQPKGRPPFVAVYHLPGAEREHLRHLAEELTPGAAALIRCRGIEHGRHEGRDVLQPVFCEGICAAQFSPFNPERPS